MHLPQIDFGSEVTASLENVPAGLEHGNVVIGNDAVQTSFFDFLVFHCGRNVSFGNAIAHVENGGHGGSHH